MTIADLQSDRPVENVFVRRSMTFLQPEAVPGNYFVDRSGPMILIPPSYFFIALGASEIGLAVFKRAGASAQEKDRGSFFALWGVIGAAIYMAIHITFAWPRFGVPLSTSLYGVGVGLFLTGTFLRWWSIIHLGRFFTVNVAIAKDHRVVDTGPYRLIRHPSYAGVFIAFIGLGLLLFNWLAAGVLILPVIPMFLWRMNVEERALRQALGEAYGTYMLRTKRLIPFVY